MTSPRSDTRWRVLAALIRLHTLRPPTLDELAEGAGLASKSSVAHHMYILEHEGFVQRIGAGGARCWTPTLKGRAHPEVAQHLGPE